MPACCLLLTQGHRLTLCVGVQVVQDCQNALEQYPQTLDGNLERLRSLVAGQEQGSMLPEILQVVVQEQQVLHRTLELARQHLPEQ